MGRRTEGEAEVGAPPERAHQLLAAGEGQGVPGASALQGERGVARRTAAGREESQIRLER